MPEEHKADPPQQYLYRFDVWVSLNDQNGTKVDRTKFLALEWELYSKFGGLTCTPIVGTPVYDGYWKDPDTGKLMRDLNTVYTVLTPRTHSSYSYFEKSKQKWQDDFNQKAILITVLQIEVL
jgi:hypothetical protein